MSSEDHRPGPGQRMPQTGSAHATLSKPKNSGATFTVAQFLSSGSGVHLSESPLLSFGQAPPGPGQGQIPGGRVRVLYPWFV